MLQQLKALRGWLRFGSPKLQGSSQQSVTLVPEDPMPSSGLHEHCMHVVNSHISGKTPMHTQFLKMEKTARCCGAHLQSQH